MSRYQATTPLPCAFSTSTRNGGAERAPEPVTRKNHAREFRDIYVAGPAQHSA